MFRALEGIMRKQGGLAISNVHFTICFYSLNILSRIIEKFYQ